MDRWGYRVCGLVLLMVSVLSAEPQPAAPGGPLVVNLTVSSEGITTSETIDLRLSASVPVGWSVSMPSVSGSFGEWAVLSHAVVGPTISVGRARYVLTARLSPFLEGDYPIPVMSVEAVSLLDPDAVPIRVETELVDVPVRSLFDAGGVPPSMHSIAGELTIPVPPSLRREIGMGLLVLMVLVVAIVYGEAKEPLDSTAAAADQALQALFVLQHASMQRGPSACLAEANEIVHDFLGAHFRAGDLPRVASDTVGRLVARCAGISTADTERVLLFFAEYDRLRFSRTSTDPRVVAAIYALFESFVTALDAPSGLELAA